MSVWNLGSVATQIQNRSDGIPTNVSGALVQMVDESRISLENEFGVSIGSVAIAEKFVPALIDCTVADMLALMQLTGADNKSFTIMDLKIEKGTDSNIGAATKYFNGKCEKSKRMLMRNVGDQSMIGNRVIG